MRPLKNPLSLIAVLLFSAGPVWAQFHADLSRECQVVLSNLGPRAAHSCPHAPALTPAQIDEKHGDGYFEYIWQNVLQAAEDHGVSPGVLMGTLMKESHFMPTAVSCNASGTIAASGIAQIIVRKAAGEEAIAQLSNSAEERFQQMLRERQAQDPNFVVPEGEIYTMAKFQWVHGIDSHVVDPAGIDLFEGACSTTNESGLVRTCRSEMSGSSNGLRGFPGCFEAIKEKCKVGDNIRSNLFCPAYNIQLSAVYLRFLSENRTLVASNPTEAGLMRAVVERYNNAGDRERNCHVHAITGRGGGFGGSHVASYCTLENDYLQSGLPGVLPAARSESVQ